MKKTATKIAALIGTCLLAIGLAYGQGVFTTVGPSSSQQHTLPSVTSDIVVLQSATQTLTNKTLTSPTISGSPALSGIGIACGSSATCAAPAAIVGTLKFVQGTIAFSSATTAAVSGISPAFTSATSYACAVGNPSHAYTSGVEPVSSSAFTIVSGTSNSDTWQYFCIGN